MSRRVRDEGVALADFLQDRRITIVNVPAIFARMKRNVGGPANLRLHRRPNRIRLIRLACLPHGGDMINIDAQLGHLRRSREQTGIICLLSLTKGEVG